MEKENDKKNKKKKEEYNCKQSVTFFCTQAEIMHVEEL